LIEQRETLLSTGLTDPFNLVMERVESPTVAICNGRRTILLGTYNYMGMTFDPDVVAAGKKALDEFGSGTTGSRVLNGTYQGHKECEAALRDFYAMDHAMVFSTGYQANLGIISTVAGKDDYIILDIDSHASIYDGCALGNAQIVPFRHNDIDALEKCLRRLPPDAGKLVVLEGVYSMLGDVAPLDRMVPLAKSHGAMVLVDEAHSMGFIGENGRGVAEAQGVIDQVDFIIGTFSKSSAPSAASASPTTPSSRSCGSSAGPTSSPPRCRRASSPPPPHRSASSHTASPSAITSGRIRSGCTPASRRSASRSARRSRSRRSLPSSCRISKRARLCGRRSCTKACTSTSPAAHHPSQHDPAPLFAVRQHSKTRSARSRRCLRRQAVPQAVSVESDKPFTPAQARLD
jgi:hypothetical protein